MKFLALKLLPFFILLFVVMGCTEEVRRQNREKAETEAREKKAINAREDIAEQLSKEFDSRPDCLFRFQALGEQSKTLLIKNCAPTTARIKPELVLTPENRTKLKSLGFEEVEVDSWESAFRSYTSLYQFNDDGTLHFVKYE